MAGGLTYLSAKELAHRLGVSVDTVRRLTQKGIIPYLRIGNRAIRYNWEEVRHALAQYARSKKAQRRRRPQK